MQHSASRGSIVVSGGGLAGWLSALIFAKLGKDVSLVEQRERSGHSDTRNLALSYSGVQVLRELDLWAQLASASSPITEVHISEATKFGSIRFLAADLRVPALGWVVPHDALLQSIKAAARKSGVTMICPARVFSTNLMPEGRRNVSLHSAAGDVDLECELLIIAEGAHSALRSSLGIRQREKDFGVDAVVTTVAVQRPRIGVAFERFTKDGILALLPRSGQKMGLVWTVLPECADKLLAQPSSGLLKQAEAASGYRLGAFELADRVMRFPLRGGFSKVQAVDRAVVIGNAAHSLHPVAAQGFNLTLRDLRGLKRCVGMADDVGRKDILESYVKLISSDQKRTLAYTGFIRTLGMNKCGFQSYARSIGLSTAGLCPPLVTALARQGMGLKPTSLL